MNINTQTQRRNIVPMRPAGGFSLIELMVAMTIGLVILAAVVQIFVRSHATYKLDEGMSRVQENARFAMDYLAKDIRMAGYLGCNSSLLAADIHNRVKPINNAATTFQTGGIKGYRYTCPTGCTGDKSEWTPPLPGDFFANGEVRTGTDVIIIQRGSDLDTALWGNLISDTGSIQIKDTATIGGQIADDDILMISDCTAADIFRVTNITPPGGTDHYTITHAAATNTSPNFAKVYQDDARVMKLVSNAYYIANSANEPGLFRKELVTAGGLQGQELVGGVEAMKILYGVDTAATGSPAKYVVPADVTDWTRVVSVRLGMIVRTPETADSAPDTNIYHLLDHTTSVLDDFGPTNDTRRRRVFNTTIRVRNH